MSKKYFTVEEANALIPELNDWVPRLQELYALMNKGFRIFKKPAPRLSTVEEASTERII